LISSYLFETLEEKKRLYLLKEKNKLIEYLTKIKDFYIEIKWNFDSNIIPFVQKILPSGKNIFFNLIFFFLKKKIYKN